MSQLFASGGQNIVTSASASVLPMNIQDWFPLGLTSLISLQSKGCYLWANLSSAPHFTFLAVAFILSLHISPASPHLQPLQRWHLNIMPVRKRKAPTVQYKFGFKSLWFRLDHLPNSEPVTGTMRKRHWCTKQVPVQAENWVCPTFG